MPVYSVEGKLGTGKTKFAVWRAKLALVQGRRVASNVDLDCTKLCPGRASSYVRIPDKPTALDLAAIGHGNPASYDEERNGVLILDELATWLNSRSFQDKGRAAVIDFLVHARKLGWDVYLIVQSANMIDKQVRELLEFECRCRRLDKLLIPIVGKTLNSLFGGRWGRLPRLHSVTASFADITPRIVAERWWYQGDDLHAAYDTRQVFTSDYPHGAHSVLVPWDWQPKVSPLVRLVRRWRAALRPAPVVRTLKPKAASMASLAGLSRDEAWRRARELARAG